MPEPTFEWVPITLIEPNPWNPNAMDDVMYGKEIESIHEFGFVDPLTCRMIGEIRQIIDGEHRWRVAKDHGRCVRNANGVDWVEHLGLAELPVTNLGIVADTAAQQLTIVLN